jgi:peptidoglycan hydrolase-like protein with peptidoglycan-binding domain
VAGVADQTPLVQAGVMFNSAAFALEIAWLQLVLEAGCLTDAQQQKAAGALHDYTVALQTDLQKAGYHQDPIDGIYGPETVAAVQKLQSDAGLPVTGLVDRATAVALQAKVDAAAASAAQQSITQTAALQSVLKLLGYWSGPIDGVWTPELTDALKSLQTALGVPATGVVDAVTLQALERAVAAAKVALTTTTTSSTTTTSTTTTSTTEATAEASTTSTT